MNKVRIILTMFIWLSVTLSFAPSEELIMKEITVTGTRVEEEVFNVPAAVSVADRGKIDRELPGTAAESLRDIAGIWVQKTGHIGGAPIIRGLMGNQILILVDGVRQNNLNLFAGPNSFLNTFDVEDIERIEVIKGPGSVLYGTDALGGVVHIITKRNKSFSEKPRITPLISTRLGSVDRSAVGRFEFKGSWKRFNFLLGSTFKKVGDLRGGGDIGVQSPSSWKERNFDLSSSLKLGEKQFLDLSLQNFYRYDVTRFDRPTWIADARRRLINLVYNGKEINPYLRHIKLGLAFHDQERERSHTKKFDNKFSDTETVQTELQLTSEIGSQRLIYGLHYHHDSTSGWRETKKGRSENPNATWDNFAVFLQDEISMFDRVRLTPAVRWDIYLLKREKDPKNPKDIGVNQKNSALTGSLGAVLRLTDFLNLTMSVGRGFRAPNNRDYRSAPSLFTFGVGVPTTEVLNPEKSLNYELGLRVNTPKAQSSIAAYYMKITDLIESVEGTYQGKDWYDWDGDGEREPR
ncbi:TPA: TonB-dependent receptor [Candidatus Poribacteria bacterium]|nr:TonB-dependent receptor [Candidatus Poribacteria bacterium]